MPPLRERGEDILMIARQFLDQFSQRDGKGFQHFSTEAEDALSRYLWPGNVRQLQNVVQQVVVLHDGERVEAAMLPENVREGHIETGPSDAGSTPAPAISSHIQRRLEIQPLWLVEKEAIETAIEACDGNINKAAGLLEVAPSTLYRKLQSWKKLSA